MGSDFEEMSAAFDRVQQEFEDEVFKAHRAGGTAMMDQYEAHVKNLLRMLLEHRPHCRIYHEHGSEMCPSYQLTEAVESMDILALQRSLVIALVMMARKE